MMQHPIRLVLVGLTIASIVSPAAAQCVAPGLQDFESATASTVASCGTNDPGVLPTGWSNDPTGTTVWRVRSGPTPSGSTGPTGDHTTGSGNYVYVETSCGAGFWSGTLISPCFDTSTLQNPTLSFWFHMYGADMGILSVQQATAQGSWSTIHVIAGDQGNLWRRTEIPIVPVNDQVQLRFFYVRGASFQSDCCLDDIVLDDPFCIAPGFENFEATTPPLNSPCAINVGGTLPQGYENSENNDTDWRAWTGPTPSGGTGPSVDHTLGSAAGKYVYAEVSGCGLGDEAILKTPCWDATQVTNPSIEFWYHLYGATAGRLDLQELRPDNTWQTVWTISGNQGDQWHLGAALLTPWGGLVRCRFRYERGSTYQSDCALDDITFGEPTPGDWQINQTAASFDVDGVVGHTLFPAALARCPLANLTLSFGGDLVGMPWDLGVTASPTVPLSAGGSATPGGQRINIDLGQPSLVWFIGGPAPNLIVPFPGSHTLLALTPPTPTTLGAQMYILNPTHVDGLQLSQSTRLGVTAATSLSGPSLDEEVMSFTPAGLPLCGPSQMTFFGTSYESVNVHSNGRISFGAGAAIDFSASPGEAATDLPFVGFWTDLDPATGTIDIQCPAPHLLRVDWSGVPYFGESATVSFSIQVNAQSGVVDVFGLSGIGVNPQAVGLATAGDRQFLGLSPGAFGAATDPGPVSFTIGGSGTGGPTDMIYDWYDHVSAGTPLVPSILGGLNSVKFTPNPAGGYDWAGF